jgi:hypothetical protein
VMSTYLHYMLSIQAHSYCLCQIINWYSVATFGSLHNHGLTLAQLTVVYPSDYLLRTRQLHGYHIPTWVMDMGTMWVWVPCGYGYGSALPIPIPILIPMGWVYSVGIGGYE